VTSDPSCWHFKRPLYAWEIGEARRVFGDGLEYNRVRVHECNPMPDRLDRIGKWLRRQKRDPNAHNAITIGNHCHFPVRLPEQLVTLGQPDFYKVDVMHRLTMLAVSSSLAGNIYGWRCAPSPLPRGITSAEKKG